jgi:transketolase
MKATRDGFGDQLVISAAEIDNIIVVNADLGKATKSNKFGETYPNRYIEVGIAENNMIGISSGLSEHGYKVFATSFASFLTGKYDTIRCSIAYSNSPVILVGSHGGLAIGRDGVTQMGLEDISLMRSLPGMMVLNPATYIETKKITEYVCKNIMPPCYMRIGRQPVKEFFDENYQFNVGFGNMLKAGKDAAIFSTGCILGEVMDASSSLDVSVINMPTIKPIDKYIIADAISKHKHVFTVEDHSIVGGLGSAVAEIIAEIGCSCKLTRIGINDIFPESGAPEDLYEKYGLSAKQIRLRIMQVLNDK